MQVISKLAKMEFKVGSIEREGERIVIVSHPDQAMKAKVYLTLEDVASMLRASLNWPIISFILSFPFLYFKLKRQKEQG
ncbi:MAG: hypothetical protein U0401_18770 [Anaerolineae bacterium]